MNDNNSRNSNSSRVRKPGSGFSKNRSGYGFTSQKRALDTRSDSSRNRGQKNRSSDSIRVFRADERPALNRTPKSRPDSRLSQHATRKPAAGSRAQRPSFSRQSQKYRRPERNANESKLKIQRWGINGEGIAYKNRKPVFVEGVIPDETAVIEITEENDKYYKGKLKKLIEESPRRRYPVCPIADKCGGCALMHVDYKGQIRAKEKLLREALKKYAGYTGEIESMIKNPVPLSYRNACKFPFGLDENGKIITGMYERNSNEFVPVERCIIHSKKLEKVRHEVDAILNRYEMKPYDRETDSGLRNLVLKEFDNQVHIILVTSDMELPAEMVDELLALEDAASVWQSIKEPTDMDFELFGSRMIHLGGEMKMTLNLEGLSLELLPRSFFQLNTAQAQNLYRLVEDWVPENTGLLVEAYSGVGAMSLYAADKADEVIGIEYVEDAVANARDNALANGKENVSFVCGDAGEELEKISEDQNVDALIVDPPRSGLNTRMKEAILKAEPEKIIYVSCNPATLGKDLKDLEEAYTIAKVQPFDMFSQTPQIETAVLLNKKENVL